MNARNRVSGPPLLSSLRGDQGQVCVTSNRNQCDDTTFAPGMSAVTRSVPAGKYEISDSCRSGAPLPMSHASRSRGAGYTVDGNSLRYSNSELCTPGGGARGRDKHRDQDTDMHVYDMALCAPERGSIPEPPLGGAHASPMGAHGPCQDPSDSMEEFGGGNRRVLTSNSARLYGTLQQVNPPKQTTHEPTGSVRTTLKETTIHDTADGFLAGPITGEARSPDADARTTGRETLDELQGARGDGRLDGTGVVFKAPVYDPYDVFETTTKETLTPNAHMGNIGTMEDRGSQVQQPPLDQTQRALTETERFGGAARTASDGYRVAEVTAVGTNRQIRPETDYRGSAGAQVPAFASDDEVYTRVIGDVKESVLKLRGPSGMREALPSGKDAVACSSSTRDPYLDLQPSRAMFQNQPRVQAHVVPGCSTQTKGGRQVYASRPDPSLLRPLASNPYHIRSK